jgi:hypothetical protein
MNSYSILTRWRHVRHGVVAVLLAAAAACGTKEAASPLEPSGPTGRIRFVNLITDPARNPVNAILENVPFGVNLGYTGTTPSSLPAPNTAIYSAILAGDRHLVLKKTADTTVTVATFAITVTANQDITVYAVGGTGGNPVGSPYVSTDINTAVPTGQTRIRIVNVQEGGAAPSIDVFITAPNADLSTATPVYTSSNGIAVYLSGIAPGTYQVRAVPAGAPPASRSANVLVSINNLAFPSGAARSIIFANNSTGGSPPIAFVLTDQ